MIRRSNVGLDGVAALLAQLLERRLDVDRARVIHQQHALVDHDERAYRLI